MRKQSRQEKAISKKLDLVSQLESGLNYIFFITLLKMSGEIKAKARKIDSQLNFNKQLYTQKNKQSNFSEQVKQAIEVLKSIADSEQQKEMLALKTFCSDIETAIKGQDNKATNKIKRLLDNIKDNNIDNTDLVTNINTIRYELAEYQTQLENLGIKISNTFNYRAQRELEQFWLSQKEYDDNSGGKDLYKTMFGVEIKDALQKRNQDIQDLFTKEYKKQISSILPDGIPIQVFYGAVFLDFQHTIEAKLIKNTDDLTQNFRNYVNKNTTLQQLIKAATGTDNANVQAKKELERILSGLKELVHANFGNNDEINKIFEEAQDTQFEYRKKGTDSEELSRIQTIIQSFREKVSNTSKKTFVFSFHTKSSHGNFYEITKTIFSKAINVQGNVAADVLVPLGELSIKMPDLTINVADALTKDFQEQPKFLRLHAKEGQRSFKDQIQRQKELTDQIAKKISEAKESLESEDKKKDFFITHESLKLYADANSTGLHGRTMNVLSALSKLSSEENVFSLDPESLTPFLLNLRDNITLGGDNETPLETYLSLFAALLMFDDIGGMIRDVGKVIPQNSGNIHQLHVYDINGKYYPISVLLHLICNSVDNAVTIDPSQMAIVDIIQEDLTIPEKTTAAAWEQKANSLINATKIKILFSAALIKTLEGLFNGNPT